MKLKDIYMGLNRGESYILRKELEIKQSLFDKGQLRYFVPSANLYITDYDNIGWCHYGSSAEKNTLKDLEWLIENIFEGDYDFVAVSEARKDRRYGVDNLKENAIIYEGVK